MGMVSGLVGVTSGLVCKVSGFVGVASGMVAQWGLSESLSW